MKTPRSILALFLGLLGLAASQVSAQTVITSAPYTIITSGQYILGNNLNSSSTSVPAITINAPNVVLDLNTFYVAGPGNPALAIGNPSTSSVIYVGNYANVTIKNGTVAGNVYGVTFSASTAGTTSRNFNLNGLAITRCYYRGAYFQSRAPGSTIRNCSFSTIGGSTAATDVSSSAIYDLGGIRIEGNNIDGVTSTGAGVSFGVNGSNGDFAISNTIANCNTGIIYVSKYIGNLTYNVTTNFSQGTAVGDNN